MAEAQSFERIRPCVVCGVYFFPLQADVDHVRAQGKHPDVLVHCLKHRFTIDGACVPSDPGTKYDD